jgi:cell division protein FtsN
MAQDYKHISRARGAPSRPAGAHGAVLPFLAGLSIGLLVAFAVFLYQYRTVLQGEAPTITVRNAAPGLKPAPAPATAPPEEESLAEPPPPTFDFYQILPNQEVSMSEWEADDAPAAGDGTPGELLILQVGSFKTAEAADQIKAELALIGIEADVQRVVIDGREVVHRVRIGPFQDQDAFAATRQRLIENDLDFVVLNLKANEGENRQR